MTNPENICSESGSCVESVDPIRLSLVLQYGCTLIQYSRDTDMMSRVKWVIPTISREAAMGNPEAKANQLPPRFPPLSVGSASRLGEMTCGSLCALVFGQDAAARVTPTRTPASGHGQRTNNGILLSLNTNGEMQAFRPDACGKWSGPG